MNVFEKVQSELSELDNGTSVPKQKQKIMSFGSWVKNYNDITSLFQNIYIGINNYVESCYGSDIIGEQNENEDENKTKAQEITETIDIFFNKLKIRLDNWKEISKGTKPKNTILIINGNTEQTNKNSKNVYDIRIGARTQTTNIYLLTNNNEKNVIEYYCDKYFYYLDQLNEFMKDDTSINKIWPYDDKSPEFVNVIKWVDDFVKKIKGIKL